MGIIGRQRCSGVIVPCVYGKEPWRANIAQLASY